MPTPRPNKSTIKPTIKPIGVVVNIIRTGILENHIGRIDENTRAVIDKQIAWLSGLDEETFTAKARPKHDRQHRIAVLDHTSPVGAMAYLRCNETVRVLFGRNGTDLTLVGLITRAN
jgi:hypothetical protein